MEHPYGILTLQLRPQADALLRALEQRYEGADHEEAMVPLLDHCGFGPVGAAPSIDTAMHALVDEPHVDHLHPDAVIALAAAADGEALTERCFGREIAWVADPLDALLLQVQGSGRLRLADTQQVVRLAFAGHNDQPYQSVGRWLVDRGSDCLHSRRQ